VTQIENNSDLIPQLIQGAVNAATPAPPDAKARLEEQRLFGDAKRSERYKSCIHWISVIAIALIGLTIVAVLIARIIHLILPTNRQWLTSEQAHSLDEYLFSGTVGGVLTQAIRKIQGKKNADSEEE
jgi:hypothetical protein